MDSAPEDEWTTHTNKRTSNTRRRKKQPRRADGAAPPAGSAGHREPAAEAGGPAAAPAADVRAADEGRVQRVLRQVSWVCRSLGVRATCCRPRAGAAAASPNLRAQVQESHRTVGESALMRQVMESNGAQLAQYKHMVCYGIGPHSHASTLALPALLHLERMRHLDAAVTAACMLWRGGR